ncbi:MAG: CinA family protein [Chloroflexi bacterium]|nr:CinA family protein [Chloroflexota bacterium]
MMVEQIAILLASNGKTVAVAEGSTGGLLGYILIQAPGASRYFLGGVTAYSYPVKERVLAIPRGLLEREGSVSREVALAMARSVRRLCQADIGLAETGIAGPGGGTPQKPVGLFYIAISAEGYEVCLERHFAGDREACRRASAEQAVQLLHQYLESVGG